jgi:hypothetical protein
MATLGYDLTFRPPDSADLAASVAEADPARRRQRLLERCMEARRDGVSVAPARCPPVIAAVDEGMAAADPLADVGLAVSCSSCRHPWRAIFDIVSFFWGEIDAWARRTLRECISSPRPMAGRRGTSWP